MDEPIREAENIMKNFQRAADLKAKVMDKKLSAIRNFIGSSPEEMHKSLSDFDSEMRRLLKHESNMAGIFDKGIAEAIRQIQHIKKQTGMLGSIRTDRHNRKSLSQLILMFMRLNKHVQSYNNRVKKQAIALDRIERENSLHTVERIKKLILDDLAMDVKFASHNQIYHDRVELMKSHYERQMQSRNDVAGLLDRFKTLSAGGAVITGLIDLLEKDRSLIVPMMILLGFTMFLHATSVLMKDKAELDALRKSVSGD